jgi:hypothetical protein
MKYEFYVEDEGDWYGVFLEGASYICVQQDVAQPFATAYPCNNDPENWINFVQRYPTKEK